jgi:hypothetical protein
MSADYWFWYWGAIVYETCQASERWDAVVEFEALRSASGR